jgi:Flp pilus assembly protein TadG
MIKLNHFILNRLRTLVRCERGGALAELAIMVPFLAVMLAIVTEVGRYYQTYTTLTKATRSSARYLSNHNLTTGEVNRAVNLVVCGKLACAGGDELVKGVGTGSPIAAANVCIEKPTATTITVRIPRTNDCVPVTGVNAPAGTPYTYQTLFNIGTLMGVPSFNFNLPISPRTTMFKVQL